MSEIPPRENPLLNTNNPQRGGYLSPSIPGTGFGVPSPPPPSAPLTPAAPLSPSPTSGSSTPPSSPAMHGSSAVVAPSGISPVTGPAGVSKTKVGNARKSSTPESSLASLIDTIEAVVIALILALTFREFVVEPFVIPTGSMAPTLLGAHFNVICPKCGYAFKEGADLSEQDTALKNGELKVMGSHGELTNSRLVPAPELRICPNCGYGITASDLTGHMSGDTRMVALGDKGLRTQKYTFPWANNGDRILVLKYLYCVLEPRRWDVVVFKEPMRATDNYIKRLVGLPGEELEVVGGDLFIRPAVKPGEPEKPMAVARKPDYVQNAEWQLVYDNDYYPTDADEVRENPPQINFTNPWKGDGATADTWTIKGPVMTYGGDAGAGPGKIHFEPRDFYLYNVRGYNNDLYGSLKDLHEPVTDVHVEAAWMPAEASGAKVAMVAGPDGNCFRVSWTGAGAEGIKLERWMGTAYETVEGATAEPSVPAPEAGKWHRLAMNNTDRQVQFFIDGRKVLEFNSPWTVEDATAWVVAHRDVEAEKKMAHVAIEVGGRCTLAHVKLMRDVYYTNSNLSHSPLEPEHGSNPLLQQGVMGKPVQLEQDEFFVMGDNSTESFDSRGWRDIHPSLNDLPVGKNNHYGIVPRRFLLGRAFFVYWPAGFRPMNGSANDGPFEVLDVPLVPNVGEMRFIR